MSLDLNRALNAATLVVSLLVRRASDGIAPMRGSTRSHWDGQRSRFSSACSSGTIGPKRVPYRSPARRAVWS